MALLSKCMTCPEMVTHRPSDMPICDKCSGKTERLLQEKTRWEGLSDAEKIEELRLRIETLENANRWDERIY